MNFEALDFGIIELLLVAGLGVIAYLWKTEANSLKEARTDLNNLRIDFAESKGTTNATNRTLFSHIEEMKEAIARIETHLLTGQRE